MTTNYHYNTGLNLHVVEFTFQEGRIDSLEPLEATPRIEGVLVCPDEPTARQIAAGGEAIELLRTVTQYEHDPKIGAMIDQFFTKLHAGKPC